MAQEQEHSASVNAALIEALSGHAGTAVSAPEAARVAAVLMAATSIVRRIAVPMSVGPASVFRVSPET